MVNLRDETWIDHDLEGGGLYSVLAALGPTAANSQFNCSYGILLATFVIILIVFGALNISIWALKSSYAKIQNSQNAVVLQVAAGVNYVNNKISNAIRATKNAVRPEMVQMDRLFLHFNTTKSRAINEYKSEVKYLPSSSCEQQKREYYTADGAVPDWSGKNRLSLRVQTAIGIVYNPKANNGQDAIEHDTEEFEKYHDPSMSYEDRAYRLVEAMFTQGACFYACPDDYAFKKGFSPFTYHIDDALMAFWCFNQACIYYSVDIEALDLTETFCAPGWVSKRFLEQYARSFPSVNKTMTKYAGLTYYVQQYTEKANESLKNGAFYTGAHIIRKKVVASTANAAANAAVYFGVLTGPVAFMVAQFTSLLLSVSLVYAASGALVAGAQISHYLTVFDPALPFESAERKVDGLGKIPGASTVRQVNGRSYAYFDPKHGPVSSETETRRPCKELKLSSLLRICMYADIIYDKQRRHETIITDGMIEYIRRRYFIDKVPHHGIKHLYVEQHLNYEGAVPQVSALRNAIGNIVGNARLLFKAYAFLTVMSRDMELFPAAMFLLHQFSQQLNKMFANPLSTKKSYWGGESLEVTVQSVQNLMVAVGVSIVGLGALTREWVAMAKWAIAKVFSLFWRFVKLGPKTLDFVCKRIFTRHAYERNQEKLGKGAAVAIKGLSEDLDRKQKEINDLKAMAEKEEEDKLNMLKEMTGASDKVLAETRSSFESLPKAQLQILACMLKQKKVREVRFMSKKGLVDLLMVIPPPSKKELEKRLLNAGLSANGSRKAMVKRAVEAGLISEQVAG